MKKEYSMPRAEKVQFNYEEVVVASGGCISGKKKVYTHVTTEEVKYCESTYIGDEDTWVGNTQFG